MLAIERKNEILDKLRAEQRVLVSDLAAYYHVTEETIRRDLDKLEKEGYATKTYGGAILGNSTKTDLSYTIRNKTNVEAKNQIAAIASRLIEDGRPSDARRQLHILISGKKAQGKEKPDRHHEFGRAGRGAERRGGLDDPPDRRGGSSRNRWRSSATRRSRHCGATTLTRP